MKELIEKVRQYLVDHPGIDGFTKALVDGEISRLETGQSSLEIFKVNISLLLQINVNDL